MEEKRALVTGGARNLGRDIAEALAQSGADVAITSRNIDSARKTAQAISRESGQTVRPYLMEITDEAAVVRTVADVIADFGQLDILVNNAGNMRSSAQHGEASSANESWRDSPYTYLSGILTGAF